MSCGKLRHWCRIISTIGLVAVALGTVTLTGSAAIRISGGQISASRPGVFKDGVVLVGFDKWASREQRAGAVAAVAATDTRTIGVGLHVLRVPNGKPIMYHDCGGPLLVLAAITPGNAFKYARSACTAAA